MGRAIVVKNLQGDVELVDVEKPRASPGHVVVRVTLRPINPVELWLTKMKLNTLELAEPTDVFAARLKEGNPRVVLGSDGVGYVEEIGEGVTKVKVGQRVVPSFVHSFYNKGEGSWQDYVLFSEDQLYTVADSLPDEIAAQYIVNPWTAYALLKDIGVSEGEWVLQTAANSALGRMVIQLAKHWGIKTINIVRRDEVKQELKSIGADEVINSSNEDVVARVKEITGGELADCGIDPVAGNITKTVAQSIKTGGRIFVIGSLAGSDDVTLSMFDLGRVAIQAWNLFLYIPTPERAQFVADEVAQLLEQKVLTLHAGKTYKLEEFKQAMKESEKSSSGGKILLAS